MVAVMQTSGAVAAELIGLNARAKEPMTVMVFTRTEAAALEATRRRFTLQVESEAEPTWEDAAWQ